MPYDSATLARTAAGQVDAVTAATRGGPAREPATASELADAQEWFDAAGDDPQRALAKLLSLISCDPLAERPQVLALRLIERMHGRAGAIEGWRAMLERFPRSNDALLITLRWLARHEGAARAAQALARAFPDPPQEAADMLLLARGLETLEEHLLADAAFARLSRRHPTFELGWLMRAQAEERRGRPWQAQAVLLQGNRAVGGRPRIAAAAQRISAQIAMLDSILPSVERASHGEIGAQVLAHLVAKAGAGRAVPAPGDAGAIALVGASLGAGGAERQMATTAIGLHAAHREGRRIGGHGVGAVSLFCRDIEDRPGGGFFAPDLARHGVPLTRYATLPEFGGDASGSAAQAVRDLLPFLAPPVAQATARLADGLRAARPKVVHLWQDGTILACALAALLAGVPRIVLSVRTAPPQDRPERDRPEYALLYPALAQLPGVTWTANSEFAAHRYATCIGMDPGRIRVVPNGVAAPVADGSPATRAMAEAFDAQTGPGFTIGAVMRLDENKRPLLLIECLARLQAQRPRARLIVVGDGPLRAQAEAAAAPLGGRVLFTGRSNDVGFWLARMDALMLLSRCEGLPNAVLEAQYAGVPVVATPAGGTAEALRHGSTGFMLRSAEAPRAEEAVARLLEIAQAGGRSGLMAQAARNFVADHFSVEAMLARTVECYVS